MCTFLKKKLCEIVNIRRKGNKKFGPDLSDLLHPAILLHTQKTNMSDTLTSHHFSVRTQLKNFHFEKIANLSFTL